MQTEYIRRCDKCGKIINNSDDHYNIEDAMVNGHCNKNFLIGDNYKLDFCSKQCLIKFINGELNKLVP